MNTIKRNIPNIRTNVGTENKFDHQMEWKGIIQNQNIYAVDQKSFYDTQNMYVDEEMVLSTRPPLVEAILSTDILPTGYTIDKIDLLGRIKIYVASNIDNLRITAEDTESGDLTHLIVSNGKYHICSIDKYIICFHGDGAKYYEVSSGEEWRDFSELLEIPVTKITVSNTKKDYPINNFTLSHKEQYIWSNSSLPILPEGDTEYELSSSTGSAEITTLEDANRYTDYRITKKYSAIMNDESIFSVAQDTVCIAQKTYLYFSLNNGKNFTKILYPTYTGWCNIAKVSEDGYYFFFVSLEGVFRCNLTTQTWTKIELNNSFYRFWGGPGYPDDFVQTEANFSQFLTQDIFAFVLVGSDNSDADEPDYERVIYAMGPGWSVDDDLDLTDEGNTNYDAEMFKLKIDDEADPESLFNLSKRQKYAIETGLKISYDPDKDYQKRLSAGFIHQTTSSYFDYVVSLGRYDDFDKILPFTDLISKDSSTKFMKLTSSLSELSDGHISYEAERLIGNESVFSYIRDDTVMSSFVMNDSDDYPITIDTDTLLYGPTIYDKSDLSVGDTLTDSYNLVGYESMSTNSLNYLTTNGKWYAFDIEENAIYTNVLDNDDSVSFTYTYLSDEEFTDVPNFSYSDTELYLAFDNILRITKNAKEGLDTLFNLPSINDQTFDDTITGLINISSTETGIFFKNAIKICSIKEDELYGYRYDYYNSKLTRGIKFGDSILNTVDGTYTLFPTRRGLAVMSYQAYLATTDQSIEFISDDIESLWISFYESGENIKMTQHNHYIYISNCTESLLIYDFNTLSWWRWVTPLKAKSLYTEDKNVQLLNNHLFEFTDDYFKYLDLPFTNNQSTIDWFATSQPLHLGAPSYFKNIKQLIFYLMDTSQFNTSISIKMKLYRGEVETSEPIVVEFSINELKTYIKRFNYWKVNNVQWSISNDDETEIPVKVKMNGMSIKYQVIEEVR